MAVAVKNKKKRGMRSHGKLPTKRTINLAILGEKPMRFGLAIPAILLIILAAAAFSKFLVLDRFAEVDAARATVYDLQRRVDAGYAELADFDDLADLYAHYTYSGFTQEELTRAQRTDVLRLIRTMILPYAVVRDWSVSGNILTVNLVGETLQQINLIVQQLEAQDMVDFCTVNTANATYSATGTGVNNGVSTSNTMGVIRDRPIVPTKEMEEFNIVIGRIQCYLNGDIGEDVQ